MEGSDIVKRLWPVVIIVLIIGLATSALAASDLFGTIKQEQEKEYSLNNKCLFDSVKEFQVIYPNATVQKEFQGYELEYLLVTENPIKNQKLYKEIVENKKSKWQHDLSLIDYLEVSYRNQNSETIKLHFKDATEQFLPGLQDYTLYEIQIGNINYKIYYEGSKVKFVTFKKELWNNKYNVHVEFFKTEKDGTITNQLESYKDKNELVQLLQVFSLENLIK